ncbi:serine/threonine-protein kinase, partial [Sphaerisporangium sp. B11E5]|uniref:serine/threonine-protein kinase n=1 Tax=Sphaerisporangium sp. B11E5 TaxID=3153563 RepID=UPI00325D6F70
MPTIRALGPADPARIASFKVTGRIGEGGHGVVYAAETGSGERVAVKILQRRFWEDDEVRRAFGADLRQAQRVTGPHVARVLAYGIHQQRLYYACEFVDGPSLWEVVERRGPRQADELEALALATLSALAAIHTAGGAHGGFKPGSVLLGPGGPRVIDFGVGRALDGPPTPGRLIGTSPFTAPEHLVGAAPGPDGDMFAWAGTMVYAATGHAPFGQDSVPAVISRILSETPDLSALPGTLLEAVAACLDKVPTRRPTARELLARLTRAGLATTPATGWAPLAVPPDSPDLLD